MRQSLLIVAYTLLYVQTREDQRESGQSTGCHSHAGVLEMREINVPFVKETQKIEKWAFKFFKYVQLMEINFQKAYCNFPTFELTIHSVLNTNKINKTC